MTGGTEAHATDFSPDAFLSRGADFLFLLMLGAMIFVGVAYARRRGGLAPRVLGWSALACLVLFALPFAATMALEAMRASAPPRDTPDGPVSVEAWTFLGSLAELGWGLALLVCGVAFVYVGWGEAITRPGRGRAKRKRARKARARR